MEAGNRRECTLPEVGGLLMRCQKREGPGQGGLQGRGGPDHAAGGEKWWGPSWLEESVGLEKRYGTLSQVNLDRGREEEETQGGLGRLPVLASTHYCTSGDLHRLSGLQLPGLALHDSTVYNPPSVEWFLNSEGLGQRGPYYISSRKA